MSYKRDFDLFVGGKSGVFKGVKIDKKACIAKNIQSLTTIRAEHEVTAMSWADEDEREILLACGSKEDRSVRIYDTECAAFTTSFACNSGKGNIKGVSRYDGAVVTAVESGEIKLWRSNGEDNWTMEAGENLERMRHSSVKKNIIATGGKEHRLRLFDLEKRSKVFEEKNVRHDWLELRVPLWISDVGFLPNSSCVVTCGRYGHVRLYDPDAQRRPVINLQIQDEALTTLAISSRDKHIVVGSGRGIMKLIDLRKPGKILNTYKDFVGGITSIACAKSNPYVVSVGLDRHLRIHHLDTKQLLKKMYLTSRLSCILLRSEFSMDRDDEVKEESSEIIEEAKCKYDSPSHRDPEYDEMFDKMPTIENEENEANSAVRKIKRRTNEVKKAGDECKRIKIRDRTRKKKSDKKT